MLVVKQPVSARSHAPTYGDAGSATTFDGALTPQLATATTQE